MISRAAGSQIENSYKELIREQLSAQDQPDRYSADWLVIAHDDPQVLSILRRALQGSSAWLVPAPQSSWAPNRRQLIELIQWATTECEVKGVVLVGHSQALLTDNGVNLASAPNVGPSERANARQPSRPSFFDRVTHSQARLQQSKVHLATQLTAIGDDSQLSEWISAKKLQVVGLLYMVASEMFLIYDPDRGTYSPLMDAMSAF